MTKLFALGLLLTFAVVEAPKPCEQELAAVSEVAQLIKCCCPNGCCAYLTTCAFGVPECGCY